MKKIVAIIDTMKIGGAQKNLLYYLSYLASQKYCVTLISLKKTNKYSIPSNITFLEILDEKESIMTNFFTVLQIVTENSKCADVIVGFMDYISNYIAYLVSKVNDTKLLLASRSHLKKSIQIFNDTEEINYSLSKLIYEKSAIIVQSSFIKKELIDCLKLENENISILSNSIDLESVANSELEIFNNNKVFIVVARFVKLKRIDIIIEAFHSLIQSKYKNIKLLITGYGEEKENLQKLVQSLALVDNVIFKEESQQILSLLKSSHVSILASEYEGFSNFILESMSQKSLVIASNIGANKELIKHKETGLLYRLNDTEDLCDKMIFSLENIEEVNNIKNKAYSFLNYFNKEKNCIEFENILLDLKKTK